MHELLAKASLTAAMLLSVLCLGLPLGLEAPFMTPNGVIYHFFSFSAVLDDPKHDHTGSGRSHHCLHSFYGQVLQQHPQQLLAKLPSVA